MNKTIISVILIVLMSACAYGLAITPVFSSIREASDYVVAYKNPTFSTAVIQDIRTTLDDQNVYEIDYLLSYTDVQSGLGETASVRMTLYNGLPSDVEIEKLVNVHALDYFATVLNQKPNPVISLKSHALIGKQIIIKEVVKEVVVEELIEG